ncbi:MAG: winged helix-turn-helix domain-containing protein [Xanthomonadales bacterium]|nr:winged helix-turn-helix domain-containing protein [Xanthomonadales bacterium]
MNNRPDARERILFNYRFGSAEFDESRFELRVAGWPVEVENRALEVLACLLRHAGEVVTKEELFDTVWAGRVTVDKVLPNAVAKLRRALGEANAERIVTQARIGYRLDGPVERTVASHRPVNRLELAVGQTVPLRGNFVLREALGRTANSEVWLATHAKTGAERVYKFSVDGERLPALRREATIARVLREGVSERGHFVELIDWNFAEPPFFLELGHAGENLLAWSTHELAALDREARIALFLQIVDAVAAAHAVGVLHKDLKPANVLIARRDEGWHARLGDFGSGRLLDPDVLDALGITRGGLGMTRDIAADLSSGTPLYIAPEIFAGQLPTVQGDVYALGLLLYQLLSGHLHRPLASGWEDDIGDALLCADIRAATEGDPQRRLASAAELAMRLRTREQRARDAEHERLEVARAKRERDALARSRAQRPYLVALAGVLVVGIGAVSWLYASALDARNAARRELERANALNRFLNEDLIGRSNPLVLAKGKDAALKDLLLAARERAGRRFADEPRTEATIHASLATLLNTIELMPEAEQEARRALELFEQDEGGSSLDALRARSMLVRVLTRTSKFDEALRELQILDRLGAGRDDAATRLLVAAAWGAYHFNRAEYADALPRYREAIAALRASEPEAIAQRDALRLDLVNLLAQVGKTAEARREGEALIRDNEAGSGGNDLMAAFAKAAVARTRTQAGELDAAEAELLDAQKTIVARLGENHSRNLMLTNDLYRIAVERRDWPRALELARRVHAGFSAQFGPDHAVTRTTLVNLGLAHYESGDATSAQTRLREALAGLAAQLPPDNPQRQFAAFWLAAVDIETGAWEEAAELVAPLDADVLEALSPNGIWAARLDVLRAQLAAHRGDTDAARSLVKAANAAFAGQEGADSDRFAVRAGALSASLTRVR